MKTVSKKIVKKGRPRAFDTEAALDAALKVFWTKGYEGTTVSDLTAAMGLNMSSLYAAFGDKESLFFLTASRYAQQAASLYERAMAKPRLCDSLKELLFEIVEFLNRPGYPPGCLTVMGALASSSDAAPVQKLLLNMRNKGRLRLQARFKQAQQEGEVDNHLDASEFARYVSTVLWGLMVQSASGATKAQMMRIAHTALQHLATDLSPYLTAHEAKVAASASAQQN